MMSDKQNCIFLRGADLYPYLSHHIREIPLGCKALNFLFVWHILQSEPCIDKYFGFIEETWEGRVLDMTLKYIQWFGFLCLMAYQPL